ncbi:MAG: heme exporter protein CcmB [Endozoicomonadaceae bacterium]|nr:heme exporter protein CcmB [Endozoicomonadaceae bacterium]
MSTSFITIIRYELLQASRSPIAFIEPILFFMLVSMLLPLSLSSHIDIDQLAIIGAGFIWICVLLAHLLSLHTLFRDDYHDGTLIQWVLSPTPLIYIIYAKLISHWIICSLPILLTTPLWFWLFHLPEQAFCGFLIILGCSTVLLTVLCAMGAALTVQQNRQTILQGLLILPWYIPVLILASFASNALCQQQIVWISYTYWLAAITTLMLTLLPFLITSALTMMTMSQ